jgi:hypothetical protein
VKAFDQNGIDASIAIGTTQEAGLVSTNGKIILKMHLIARVRLSK